MDNGAKLWKRTNTLEIFFFLKRSSKTRMELYKSDTFIGGNF